jgi:hypothetical protein
MTSLFSELPDRVPDDEVRGIHLDPKEPIWEIDSPKDFSPFVRALVDLLPSGCIAYIEGGFPRGKVNSFLHDYSIPEVSHIHMGTIYPRPQVHHVSATVDNLLRLADVAEGASESEILWHFHVYQPGKVLLQWYDAFDLPLGISMNIPEEKIHVFCKKLGVSYKAVEGNRDSHSEDATQS